VLSPLDVGCLIGAECVGCGAGGALSAPQIADQLSQEAVEWAAPVQRLKDRWLADHAAGRELVWNLAAVGAGGDEECRAALYASTHAHAHATANGHAHAAA
jgi:hypothetical protein